MNGLAGLLQGVEQAQHDRPRGWDGHELEPQTGDHAERALSTDDQLRQLQPGGRLFGARADRAGLDHLSVRQHHFEAQDPGAGWPVLDGAHPVRVGRGHAANCGHATRAGIRREQQAMRRQRGVQLGVHDARLAEDLHVGDVDFQHAVHRVQRQHDAATQGDRARGLASGGAARRDGDAVLIGIAQDRADVCGGGRDDDRVR